VVANCIKKLERRVYSMADFWYIMTGWIQEPLAGFWATIIDWPFIGTILRFLEELIGRGPTL